MVTVMLILMFAFLILGFPMVIPLIGTSLVALFIYLPSLDPTVIIQQLVGGMKSFVLLAIPMFIFSADIMSSGQLSQRLLNLVQAFVGHIRGGLAITTIGSCGLFGAISGSTQATIAAIGRPMRQKMIEEGYDDSKTMSMIVNAADLAILIPPSSIMIIYGVVTGTSVGELFISGIIPGLLILAMFSVYCYIEARKNKTPVLPKTTFKEKLVILRKSLLSLGFPAIVLGGIYSGIFSPTEAAAVSVLYAIIVEVFIYKSLKLKDIPGIATSTGIVTAIVFILVGAGAAFSYLIAYARIQRLITTTLLGTDPSVLKILLVVNVFFFIACMFVDSIVVIFVVTPIFFPIAMQAGIDPVFLGVLITLQAGIGAATPPFGCNLFTATALFNRPYADVVRGTPPYIIMLLIATGLLIMFPEITLFLRDFVFA